MHVSLRYLVSGRTLKNTDDIDWYSVNNTLPIRDIPRALRMKLPDWEGGISSDTGFLLEKDGILE